ALHWDGYDDFGRVVPPGEYAVSASAATTGGTVHGSLNISIVPDHAVHRQYLRSAPYQDEGYVIDRGTGSAVKTTTSARGRRR
ncbi:MAG TPA: hypothetical protein PKD98_17810, partial [Anaerolineae bacterium]|nr:hypothetical protein [Anaerolineae bacterium]